MIVFCPNCGTQGAGVGGARSTCAACGSIFEVPSDGPRREAAPPPKPVAAPVPPAAPRASFSPPQQPIFASVRGRAAPTRTNTLAIISLVAGILCCVPAASPLVAIGAGILALRQIDGAVETEGGRGLAIAGIILGAISALLHVFWLIGTLNRHW